jgi:membrane protein YdbS with pleckstrin-like domain
MAQRPRSSHAAKVSRADELRKVLRIDWVIYAVVIAIVILALAGLHPSIQIDHVLVGSLITFATGVISGLFAYLRYKANGKEEEEGPEDE